MKSKLQEIQQLGKFASSVESGGYLADLFSQDMLTWVERQIIQDMPPDLYLEATALREASLSVTSQLNKTIAERDDLRAKNQSWEVTCNILKTERDGARAKNEAFADQVTNQLGEIVELREILNEKLRDHDTLNVELQQHIGILTDENISLKRELEAVRKLYAESFDNLYQSARRTAHSRMWRRNRDRNKPFVWHMGNDND